MFCWPTACGKLKKRLEDANDNFVFECRLRLGTSHVGRFGRKPTPLFIKIWIFYSEFSAIAMPAILAVVQAA